jgi:N-acyl-L-homoserine lactone synthetase
MSIEGKYFILKKCETEKEIHRAKRLRYKVYSIEKDWESPSKNNEETDDLDNFAEHYLVFNKHDSRCKGVGTFRLLPAEKNEHLSAVHEKHRYLLKNSVEISRFLLLKSYRKLNHVLDFMSIIQQHFEEIEVDHAIVLVEKRLVYLLRVFGLRFKRISGVVKVNGNRYFYCLKKKV